MAQSIQRPAHNDDDISLLKRWREAVTARINRFITGEDIEVSTIGKGIILVSPNGTRWRVTVNNAGVLVVTSL